MDTTVQPKAIQHPTDARLYRKVHQSMLRIAAAEGVQLRQSYTSVAKFAFLKQARHMKAKPSRIPFGHSSSAPASSRSSSRSSRAA